MKRLLVFLWLAAGLSACAWGGSVTLPGDVNSLCYYDQFFYNLPEGDFLYYFNDALLFTEPPDDNLYENGMRDKFLRLVRRHGQVREFIVRNGNARNLTVTLDLKDEKGFALGVEFLELLGLELRRDAAGLAQVRPADEEFPVQYHVLYQMKASVLQDQLRRTGIFFFKLRETSVSLPWDFSFLSAASGLKIDAGSFFEQMTANKRFSLLLAVLYRLSAAEVDFINGAPGQAWKRIYLDRKMLMGMLVLGGALRVRDGRWFLPGGDRAAAFWGRLSGCDPRQAPMDFLAALCGQDNGKLNYFYLFSYFLPEANRRALSFDYDAAKVGRLLQKITLSENEKIKANAFPRLESFTFYSLMLALQVREGRIVLPLGAAAWAKAMGLAPAAPGEEFEFLESLLAASGRNGRKSSLLQKFITLYAKFGERPLLLTPELLGRLFAGFARNHTLLDYLERIPLKDAAGAEALLAWQEKLQQLGARDRPLYAALAQSVLETIAQAAGFAPGSVDFDAVLNDLLAIPLERPSFYDGLFAFMKRQGGLEPGRSLEDGTYLGFILRGLNDQDVRVGAETYEWRVRELSVSNLQEMISSQEACSLSALDEINGLLSDLAGEPDGGGWRARRLRDACAQLPYPDFSDDAPNSLKDRVLPYDKEDLDRAVGDLLELCGNKAGRPEIARAIAAIKGDYLLPCLKDHFLALAYALNARSPKLRMFQNPNLARLHDFTDAGGSPWESGCSAGNKSEFSGYYLRGGLSRLNLAFAVNWRGQLFEKNIFNSEQTQAMVYNIIAALPQLPIRRSGSLDALLVELAVEMLQECRADRQLAARVRDAALDFGCGYHYRRLDDFLSGQAADYHLFFTELRQLGLALAADAGVMGRFSQRAELERLRQMPLSAVVAAESDPWGNIYYNSRGSVLPRAGFYFPQEAAQWFASGWLSGETLAEYKVKAAFLAHKNELPPCLIGQYVFDFVATVGRSLYAQNHVKDYHSTHFVLDVMNSAHLKNTLKKLQKSGFLRLK